MQPLKNLYTLNFLQDLSKQIKKIYPQFLNQKFLNFILDDTWNTKELKQRMRQITLALGKFLPQDYKQSIGILEQVIPFYRGFLYSFFPDFVEVYGLNSFEVSIKALEKFTPYTSAEFAVRAFLQTYPQKTIQWMQVWAKDPNEHIRRLASEGCRPRLPWARSLPEFKKNPSCLLPILNSLKNDTSLYVRRSVANNLNDIAKDNPEIVVQLAKKWFGKNKNTNWMIKHACRNLLKQAQPEIMLLFQFPPPKHIYITDFLINNEVQLGEKLYFSFRLNSKAILGNLRLEYAIYFLKKNKTHNKKIFQIAQKVYTQTTISLHKNYHFKDMSTRKHYSGIHQIAIIVNGVEMARESIRLVL